MWSFGITGHLLISCCSRFLHEFVTVLKVVVWIFLHTECHSFSVQKIPLANGHVRWSKEMVFQRECPHCQSSWNYSVPSFSTLYACPRSGVTVQPLGMLGGVWWLLCLALIPTGWLWSLWCYCLKCVKHTRMLRHALFWIIVQRVVVISYRRFCSKTSASNFRIYTMYYPRRVDMSTFCAFLHSVNTNLVLGWEQFLLNDFTFVIHRSSYTLILNNLSCWQDQY
jgi:hypothetical protein